MKIGIQQIRDDIREKLRRLRNAERIRKKRKKNLKKFSQFIKDPYKFAKTLFVRNLESTQKEIDQLLNETHRDEQREVPLRG